MWFACLALSWMFQRGCSTLTGLFLAVSSEHTQLFCHAFPPPALWMVAAAAAVFWVSVTCLGLYVALGIGPSGPSSFLARSCNLLKPEKKNTKKYFFIPQVY